MCIKGDKVAESDYLTTEAFMDKLGQSLEKLIIDRRIVSKM